MSNQDAVNEALFRWSSYKNKPIPAKPPIASKNYCTEPVNHLMGSAICWHKLVKGRCPVHSTTQLEHK